MSRPFRVVPTVTLQEDIERLEEYIVQRELASNTPDDTCLFRLRDALERGLGILSSAPHTGRRSESQRVFRELIIPFGHGGRVVFIAIRDVDVVLFAARDEHEHDYR